MPKIKLDKPTLILGCGVAASGKTTTFNELVKHIYDTFIINKDLINKAFLGTHNELDTGIFRYKFSGSEMPMGDYFGQHVKFQSYHCMLELAKNNLLGGKHPILEAPYTKEIISGYLENILLPFFENLEHQTKIIYCHADETVIRYRLKKRAAHRDKDKLTDENWQNFLKQQPILPKELELYDHIKINTNPDQFFEKNIERIIKYLSS